jgi:hypothetical protein
MFAAECRSDNADHFAKFIGVVAKLDMNVAATMDSSKPRPNRGHVAK